MVKYITLCNNKNWIEIVGGSPRANTSSENLLSVLESTYSNRSALGPTTPGAAASSPVLFVFSSQMLECVSSKDCICELEDNSS